MSLLVLASKIVIYDKDDSGATQLSNPTIFDFVGDLQISSSWRSITDTATVTIPRFISDRVGEDFRAKVKQWAKTHPHIEVYLGYGEARHLAFKGVVRYVKGRAPIELICEDDMCHFKTRLINGGIDEITVRALADRLFKKDKSDEFNVFNAMKQPIRFDAETLVDFPIGAIDIENQTAAQVFEQLRDDYGLHTFIRYHAHDGEKLSPTEQAYKNNPSLGPTLYIPYLHISTQYPDAIEAVAAFEFYNNIIEDELEFSEPGDIPVQIVYSITSGRSNQKKIKVVVPESENEEEQGQKNVEAIEFNIDKPIGEIDDDFLEPIKNFALSKLAQIQYAGFRGSITTFGDTLYTEPDGAKRTVGGFIKHGQVIELYERAREEENNTDPSELRTGFYYVDGVEYSFGPEGFRQQILLGKDATFVSQVESQVISDGAETGDSGFKKKSKES